MRSVLAHALCSRTCDRCAAHKDRAVGTRRDASYRRHGTPARKIFWNDRRVLDGHASAISSAGVAPGISERRHTRERIAAIDAVMHEKPSDERAHSHTCRFFSPAMLLDEIRSIGHRTLTARQYA